MEGKNCFRTKWAQQPVYSGGNLASLAIPKLSSQFWNDAENLASVDANETDEYLALCCGDTLNIVQSATGETVTSYTLPIEDVILCVDAVTLLETKAKTVEKSSEVKSENPAPKTVKKKGKKVIKTDGEPEVDEALVVPRGCYVVIATRSLQLYLFRIVRESNTPTPLTKNKASQQEADTVATDIPYVYTMRSIQVWTAAQQAVSSVRFSTKGHYIISASTDGSIKVWNAFHHHLTHNLQTPDHSLVQSVYLDPKERYLLVGSFEGHVNIFDFVSKTLISSLQPHFSAVEALMLSQDGQHIFSVARDQKLSIFHIDFGTSDKKVKVTEKRSVALKEHISSALFEDPFTLHVGSMDGIVATYEVSVTDPIQSKRRLPRSSTAKVDDNNEESYIRSLLIEGKPKGFGTEDIFNWKDDRKPPSNLFIANSSFGIQLIQPQGAAYVLRSTLLGFLDQVLDIKLFPFSEGDNKVFPRRVVVNNSKYVNVLATEGCISNISLTGHEDIVLCCSISSNGEIIATAGKDQTVRFWSTETWQTVAIGIEGHTSDITALCFNAKQTETYCLLFSVGSDENLRAWDVTQNVSVKNHAETTPFSFTHRTGINSAHAGPIYALAVAPNDQYVATGGKDKAINLWNITGKKLFKEGSLQGHRRGISALCFSIADRILASSSNDGSVRLWSLSGLSCIKVLQTDKVPILQLAFFANGSQIVTGNAEGVLRVWAVASAESVWSAELHSEKIWALSVFENQEETIFLSGSADGYVIATEDYTVEEVERIKVEHREMILNEQKLANAIRVGEFMSAFRLALRLKHPRHLRQVLLRWSAKDLTGCDASLRNEILPSLKPDEVLRLLEFAREWLTNARYCHLASLVVSAYLSSNHFKTFGQLPVALLESLMSYSRKHSRRQHEILTGMYYLDYVLKETEPKMLTTLPPHHASIMSIEDSKNESSDGRLALKKARIEK